MKTIVAGAGGGGGSCFRAGTRIKLENNQSIEIEKLKIGDEILAFDEAGEVHLAKVTKVHYHAEPSPILRVRFWKGEVFITPNHWVLNQYDAFAEIGRLTEEDALVDGMGHLRPIIGAELVGYEPTWNLTVEPHHTFIANDIRVHNGGHRETHPVVAGAGGGSKSKGSGRAAIEAPDSLQSRAMVSVLDLLGEGKIGGLVDGAKTIYFDDTTLMDEGGNYNFPGVTWGERLGDQIQDPIDGFDSVETPFNVSVKVTNPIPVTRTVTNPNATQVRIIVTCPSLFKQDATTGDISGTSVTYKFEISTNNRSYEAIATETITGKTRSRYQRSHLYDLPRVDDLGNEATTWSIKMTRLSADSGANVSNDCYFDSYVEIVQSQLSYPNSALVGVTIDSELFNQIPERSYLVDGLLIKVPNNYDAETNTYNSYWDGQSFNLASSSNPAWILYDLLTSERYGLGRYVRTDQIDVAKLYAIGKYCDEYVDDGFGGQEKRFAINTAVQSQAEAYKLISDICAVFRGMAFWSGSTVGFMQDAPTDPSMIYGASNVIDGVFTYTGNARRDRHSVVLVTWNDPTQNYKRAIEYVEDQELVSRYGIRKLETIAFGCTSRGQANRVGRWILYTERYSEMVTFKAGLDSSLVMPGEVIRIHDPWRAGARLSGRSTAATTTSLTLDAPVTLNSAEARIAVMLPDGSMEERAVVQNIVSSITVERNLMLDAFSGTTGETLQAYSTKWQQNGGHSGYNMFINASKRVERSVTGAQAAAYIYNEAPPSADYTARANMHASTSLDGNAPDAGIIGRASASAITFYMFRYQSSTGKWQLYRAVNGSYTVLAEQSWSFPVGRAVPISMKMTGNRIVCMADGNTIFDHLDDTPITDAGFGGMRIIGRAYTGRLTIDDFAIDYNEEVPSNNSTITWVTPLSDTPLVGGMWSIADDIEPMLARVVNIKQEENLQFAISAIEHNPEKYASIEEGLTLEPIPTSRIPTRPAAVTELVAYTELVQSDPSQYAAQIAVSWVASEYATSYRVSWKRENENWQSYQGSAPAYDIKNVPVGTYTISVVAINAIGSSGSATTITHEVTSSGVSPDVTNLRLNPDFLGQDLQIAWDAVAGAQQYVVQIRTTGDALIREEVTSLTNYNYNYSRNLADGGPRRDLKVAIKAKTPIGESANWTTQTFSNAAPAAPTGVTTEAGPGQVGISAIRPADQDLVGMIVWASTDPSVPETAGNKIYQGVDNSYMKTGLAAGQTYYFKVAFYDGFGTAGLNVSSSVSATPTATGGVQMVTSLPTDPSEVGGDAAIFLDVADTTIRGMYGWDGSAWQYTRDGAYLVANSVTADQMGVSDLSAISANLGTMSAGNITLNGDTGWIKGGAISYLTNPGFWLGSEANVYKFRVGDMTNAHMSWDGDQLFVGHVANNHITFSPTHSEIVFVKPNAQDVSFSVNSDGNAIFAGSLSGATGTFGGTLQAGVLDAAAFAGILQEYSTVGTVNTTVPAMPAGWSSMSVRITPLGGGGGGGSAAAGYSASAGGGGAGQETTFTIHNITPGSAMSVVVGHGGAGGVSGYYYNIGSAYGMKGSSGANGGASGVTIMGSNYYASGGVGGTGGGSDYGRTVPFTGVGGSIGGQNGVGVASGTDVATGGSGGSSSRGSGGSGRTTTGLSASGQGAGGGGSGNQWGGAWNSGGAGTPGYVKIEFFDPNSVVTNTRYQSLIGWLDSIGHGSVPSAAR